jgi:hypothetical protein
VIRFYIVDRGVDNNRDPRIVDGKMYEVTAPSSTPNSSPLAVEDSASTALDTPVTIDVAANDTDPNGNLDPATANTACATCANPAHGALANNGDGTFTYTPAPGFTGSDGFLYEICDRDGLCDTAAATVTTGLSTIEVRVTASADDAEERATGYGSLTSSDLELVEDSSVQTVGLRFPGITVPQGAAIVDAYVQFQVDEVTSQATDLIVEGEASDQAASFVSSNGNLSSRPRTAAAIAWSPPPWTAVGVAGLDQRTPELAAVIQEIVARPGWASGNALVLLIRGSGRRVAEAYDGVAAVAPLLHVVYAAGASASQMNPPKSSKLFPANGKPWGVSAPEKQGSPNFELVRVSNIIQSIGCRTCYRVFMSTARNTGSLIRFRNGTRVRQRLTHLSWFALPLVLLSLLASPLAIPSQVVATTFQTTTTTCSSSAPGSGAYTVTLCIESPADGTTMTGIGQVEASVAVSGTDPGTQQLIFYLDGQYLLTDYEAPFRFELPSDQFVDGSRQLTVVASMRDGFLSNPAAATVNFANGVTTPPVNTHQFTPRTGTQPQPNTPFVLAAVGDGASGEEDETEVTDLLVDMNPNLFLYLGDVYEKGTLTEFYNWYGTPDRFYGRLQDITDPTIGNHEYEAGVADGYFNYWDNVPDYYSFDVTGWHVISLNSNYHFIPVQAGSAQYNWLAQDLESHTVPCTIAYFHHPVFSVGPEGSRPQMSDIWSLLAQHGVDILLAGHDHSYQRWSPLDQDGEPDAQGITEFVVGSGGHGIQSFIDDDPRLVRGFDSPEDTFGALRLELNPGGAAFRFVNTQGKFLDSGIIPCSGAGPDTTAPTVPDGLSAVPGATGHVTLKWAASRDATGVAGYTIYRNDTSLTTIDGTIPAYVDTSTMLNTPYTYTVAAFDPFGNHSAKSDPISVTTPSNAIHSFTPLADTYVSEDSPDASYGDAMHLRADATPDVHSYLRFHVQNLTGYILGVKLRIYANSGSSVGYQVHALASNTWDESTTYNNAPALNNLLGQSGPFIAGTWTEVDVTKYVTGEGMVDLALTTNSSTAISLASREDTNSPQLVIETADTPPLPDHVIFLPAVEASANTAGPLILDGRVSSYSLIPTTNRGSTAVLSTYPSSRPINLVSLASSQSRACSWAACMVATPFSMESRVEPATHISYVAEGISCFRASSTVLQVFSSADTCSTSSATRTASAVCSTASTCRSSL